jgi:hypothetical protein
MRVGSFFTLNIAGTVARLYLIRRLGEAFDEPIQAVLRFFARYRLPLFGGLGAFELGVATFEVGLVLVGEEGVGG